MRKSSIYLAFFFPGVLLVPRFDNCLPDDDAPPPDCLNVNERTYIPHPYNCSRFWECEPGKAHCLNECPPTETGLLYFNPDLNVCDWPENVDCENSGPCNCQPWQQCQAGVCTPECASDSDCTGGQVCDEGSCFECSSGGCGTCGECVNHQCVEPDCCQDADCQGSSVCTAGECQAEAECSTASDCAADEYCANGECIVGCLDDSSCTGCSVCVNNSCTQPECCPDSEASDCSDPAKPVCSNDNTCVECIGDEHCEQGEYCAAGVCVAGCTDDSSCPSCDSCVNNQCEHPQCCQDTESEDCTDVDKPICSSDNICSAGCRKTQDCAGYDGVCDAALTTCSYCDVDAQECKPGCSDSSNCDGFHCGRWDHTCKPGLLSILLDTKSCTGCQGSQGVKVEDGPFLVLAGSSGSSCNTRQLDNPDQIDFDNGKSSEFSDETILQSCYKADLASVTDGSLHWTAKQGLWTPQNQQIKLRWSGDDELVCCCLSRPDLSPSNPVAKITVCSSCTANLTC